MYSTVIMWVFLTGVAWQDVGLNTDEPERPPADRTHDQSKSLAFSPSCSSSQESSRGYSLTFKHKKVKSKQLFAASSGKHPGEEKGSMFSLCSVTKDLQTEPEVLQHWRFYGTEGKILTTGRAFLFSLQKTATSVKSSGSRLTASPASRACVQSVTDSTTPTPAEPTTVAPLWCPHSTTGPAAGQNPRKIGKRSSKI